MKYLAIFIFYLLSTVAFAETSKQNTPVAIKYTLNLTFDKERQEIAVDFHNESTMDLKIRWDYTPFSLFLGGLDLSAFEDSKSLAPVPIPRPIGHSPTLISIPAKGNLKEWIDLYNIKKEYCGKSNKNHILFFWGYSYFGDDFILPPSVGAFRIKKSDIDCKDR